LEIVVCLSLPDIDHGDRLLSADVLERWLHGNLMVDVQRYLQMQIDESKLFSLIIPGFLKEIGYELLKNVSDDLDQKVK
jgi:hypothetical protein